MFQIAPEIPDDLYEVENLYDLTFAPGRTALSSYRLRAGMASLVELSLVARDEYGSVSGAIRYWPVRVGDAAVLLLGPVAVHPTRQGEGLGNMLIAQSLARARELGWSRVILVGDEPYYHRFGFRCTMAENLRFPPPTNPERVLGCALVEGAFDEVSGAVESWLTKDEPLNY
ncbi:MAG: N-acetyltransferase [Paracoccaceae bacterium]